jgi:hypothetical protein
MLSALRDSRRGLRLYCYSSRAVNTSNRVRRITAGAERSGTILQRTGEDGKFPINTLNNRLRARLIPYNDDAMPLCLGVPFFVGTFPGPLSRQRKNRVLAVCRLDGVVLRALAEITDEMNSVLVHFVSPFLPL